jgi:hypothetical protein
MIGTRKRKQEKTGLKELHFGSIVRMIKVDNYKIEETRGTYASLNALILACCSDKRQLPILFISKF